MRIKRITSASEALARNIIRTVLVDTKWSVALKLPIQEVIGKEATRLSEGEFSLYTRGHFDFVVYREIDDVPKFAVEFDGFSHETERQIARDIIKNRFCAQAALPLLRIGTTELSEHEEITVLEWLLDRFIDWEEHGLELVPKLAEVGVDPENDPSRARDALFDLFHDENLFPGNWAALVRLYERFRIAPQARGREHATPSAPYRLELDWPGKQTFEDGPTSEYVVVSVPGRLLPQGRSDAELFTASGRARFAWANKIRPVARAGDATDRLRLTVAEWAERGLAPQVMPWLNPSAIASDIAMYQVLQRVERWAERNLTERRGLASRVTSWWRNIGVR